MPPKRKVVLNKEEKNLLLKMVLRYFPVKLHPVLATEFANELKKITEEYTCTGTDLTIK